MKELLTKHHIPYHSNDFESEDDILAVVADDLETSRLFDYGNDDDSDGPIIRDCVF
jgi:hypothetical protein